MASAIVFSQSYNFLIVFVFSDCLNARSRHFATGISCNNDWVSVRLNCCRVGGVRGLIFSGRAYV